MAARGTGATALTYQQAGEHARLVKTVNGHSGSAEDHCGRDRRMGTAPRWRVLHTQGKGSGSLFAIDWVTGRSRNWGRGLHQSLRYPLCGSMYSQATVSQGSPSPHYDWLASGAGVIRGTEKETLGSTGGCHQFVVDPGQLKSCLSPRALFNALGRRL